MTDGLRPYPEYKDSGLLWLGQVPAHWDIIRCKYIFREVDERSRAGEEMHLSMSQQQGLVKSSNLDGRRLHSESYSGGKLCQVNDLVLNRLKAHLGVFAHARLPGVVSPDYTVLRPLHGDNVVFFELVFKTPACIAELRCSTKGIVEGFWRLYTNDFYNICVPVPPIEERDTILRFVKAVDTKISRFIRNRRRLIQVLNEQKQAIINRAVTRGLDPNASLKPSGIDWLGEIPGHWKVMRLKSIATVVLGKMLKTTPSPGYKLRPYLRSANIQWWIPQLRDVAEMWFSEHELEIYRLAHGDILVSEGGEVGRACLWEAQMDECYIQNSVHKVSPGKEIRSRFLLFQFFTMGQSGHFGSIVNRVSIAHLTREKLVTVKFVVPPLAEQDEIIAFVEQNTSDIDNALQRAQIEINLIREYRTRLITDVVTGKADVRHLAPEYMETEPEDLGTDLDDEITGDEAAGLDLESEGDADLGAPGD